MNATKAVAQRNQPTPFWSSRDPFFGPVFDRFFGEPARPDLFAWSEDARRGSWTPAVDIRETDEAFHVHAELPGLTKEDVQITLENNVLRLSGERRFEKEDEKDSYHRIERAYGSFTRSFSVPDDADDSKVSAEFKDGVLTVRLVKSEKSRPKAIDVKVG